MRKKIYSAAFSLLALSSAPLLHAQPWAMITPYPGPRTSAVGFTIGSYGYIATGFDSASFRRNMYKYDPATNGWTQVTSLGGATGSGLGRDMAFCFVVSTNAYIGTGQGGSPYLNDMWQYASAGDFWTQKATFPGTKRRGAVAFDANGRGYVCCGQDSLGYKNDCWEYNPSSNTWVQKANFIGTPRRLAVGFSISGKGYVGTGDDGTFKNDFYEYDPSLNIWIAKAAFPGTPRYGSSAMVINGKGYVGCGYDYSLQNRNDFWEYDPSLNTWTQKSSFFGTSRANAVAFAIGSIGYLGTGYDGLVRDDMWKFDPTQTGIGEEEQHFGVNVYPNPVADEAKFTIENARYNDFTFRIFTLGGRLVRAEQFSGKEFTFRRENLPNGIYLYEIRTGNSSSQGKLILAD